MTCACLRWLWPCLLVGLLALPAFSQEPPEPDPDAPRVIRLDPQPMEGIKTGRAVVVKGETGPEGHRFMLDGLTALMPVTVLVRPVSRGEDVAITLSKYAWNQPLREDSTDGDTLKFRIRTESEFQITVSAPEPGTDYRLLVWVGDEVKPDMAPIVVKASEFDGGQGLSWLTMVLAGVAVLLLAVIALLLVFLLRRKKG
ncbi:hypothetical protein [Arenimonas sp. MALMAid1274]|uniref:hypothetical protein n=1 Tax=Arenimonas sp. MALMAid1274 TaxID=3411630 RepID=UPI003B9DFDE0